MASLTRWVSIRPFFSRFAMRDALEEPEERQAMVKDLGRELWSLESRGGLSGRRRRRAVQDSLESNFKVSRYCMEHWVHAAARPAYRVIEIGTEMTRAVSRTL